MTLTQQPAQDRLAENPPTDRFYVAQMSIIFSNSTIILFEQHFQDFEELWLTTTFSEIAGHDDFVQAVRDEVSAKTRDGR